MSKTPVRATPEAVKLRVMKRLALLFAGLALFANDASTHPLSLPADVERAVDEVGSRALAGSPGGIVIAVAWGGRPVVAKGYGEADVERHVAATGDTIFPICSISKNFAAAAVLKLVEEGRIELDAPITRYFANDPLPGRAVTVRELLDHTSGAGSYNEGPAWDAMEGRAIPREEMAALIASGEHGEPGRTWGYSNSAFYLAGLLVERVSGKDYWAYLDEAFFRPLAMRHSRSCVGDFPRAHGYRVVDGRAEGAEKEHWANPFAGGGLCATAPDLLTWEAALDAGRALRPSSVTLMRTPTRPREGPTLDYGLGTRMGSLAGHRVVGHTGGGQGFSTVLLHFPDDDLSIVVFRNATARPGASVIAARLARRLLGLPPFAPKDLPVPEALRDALAGDWIGDDGPFRLRADGERLRVEVGDELKMPTPYQGDRTFVASEDEIFVIPAGFPDWGLLYGGGLFENPARRVGPQEKKP